MQIQSDRTLPALNPVPLLKLGQQIEEFAKADTAFAAKLYQLVNRGLDWKAETPHEADKNQFWNQLYLSKAPEVDAFKNHVSLVTKANYTLAEIQGELITFASSLEGRKKVEELFRSKGELLRCEAEINDLRASNPSFKEEFRKIRHLSSSEIQPEDAPPQWNSDYLATELIKLVEAKCGKTFDKHDASVLIMRLAHKRHEVDLQVPPEKNSNLSFSI